MSKNLMVRVASSKVIEEVDLGAQKKVFNLDGSQWGRLHSKGVGGNTLEGEELIYRRFGAPKAQWNG